jgi:hypothetical protein
VSDGWIRIIPTDPDWQPSAEAAAAAAALAGSVYESLDEVEVRFHEGVAVIDSGVNTAHLVCPRCGATTDIAWLLDDVDGLLVRRETGPLPCCGETVPISELLFDWPMGFAAFEVGLLNPVRSNYELTSLELEEIGGVLGHPVKQVLAHY